MSYWKWLIRSLKSIIEEMFNGAFEMVYGLMIIHFGVFVIARLGGLLALLLGCFSILFGFFLSTHALYRGSEKEEKEVWVVEEG